MMTSCLFQLESHWAEDTSWEAPPDLSRLHAPAPLLAPRLLAIAPLSGVRRTSAQLWLAAGPSSLRDLPLEWSMGNCWGWLFDDGKGAASNVKEVNTGSGTGRWDFESAGKKNDAPGTGDVHGMKLNGKAEDMIRQRAKAAVLGSFVADAATMGLHWIYNVSHLQDLLKKNQGAGNDLLHPEFFEPPSCPFYKYTSGELSPYGFEAKTVLESIADVGGVDGQEMSQHMYKAFKQYASGGGYLNSPSRELVANCDAGSKYPEASAFDDQANSMVKVASVVARYAGMPELVEKIKEAVKAHQNHERAEASAVGIGLVLEKIIVDGVKAKSALEWALQGHGNVPHLAKSWIKSAASKDGTPVPDAIGSMGQSCHLPGAFQGPIYTAYFAPGYVEAVRENIVAGGDSCSRAVVTGALLGAQDGLDAVPDSWKAKVNDYEALEQLVDRVIASRPEGN
ncbi:unnamed protein product [Ostreobium quekettii]|uniref:ADP-ribosylation/Crystallin J1 n=1 Tax=Ostreobium quekettii TaxID=121088 RepID=A0A8S1J3M0_9CHLO|nr:unnamed protein product [Ostreobium quekettii]|eukprot:evm.model.scf_1776.3 EVM.evm.TU.scf_1776.3   scf_1776:24488-28382(-)